MQQLFFNGRQLKDKKLVFDYNIHSESTLDLQPPLHLHAPLPNWIAGSINITILMLTGRFLMIGVKGIDTAHNLKSRIYDLEGFPPGEHSKLEPSEHKNFLKVCFCVTDRSAATDYRWTANSGIGGWTSNFRIRDPGRYENSPYSTSARWRLW